MSQQETYQEKLEALWQEWSATLKAMETKAEQATREFSQQVHEQMAGLRPTQDEIKKRLSELKDTSEEAWREVQGGLEKARQELRTAMEKATAKFTEPKT